MRRRDFMTLLGGATATWPFVARAQQPTMPVIGYLNEGSPQLSAHIVAGFRKGLGETGYIEGRNLAIEFRWAHNDNARLPGLAADLVHLQVAAIATPGSTTAARVAKAATTMIPIVFSGGGDPVRAGLVASLNHPGGNATGVGGMTVELGAKRLELLRELLPAAEHFAVLVNPNIASTTETELRAAALVLGRQIEVFTAGTPHEIDTAFATLVQKRANALLVSPSTLFINRRVQLATLAVRYAVPVIFPFREDTEAGGLMSYGPSITDNARLAGVYTGRVLKGDKPADLPVIQPTKFEFVINLQTAKMLGLDVPPMLLLRADEVIE